MVFASAVVVVVVVLSMEEEVQFTTFIWLQVSLGNLLIEVQGKSQVSIIKVLEARVVTVDVERAHALNIL